MDGGYLAVGSFSLVLIILFSLVVNFQLYLSSYSNSPFVSFFTSSLVPMD